MSLCKSIAVADRRADYFEMSTAALSRAGIAAGNDRDNHEESRQGNIMDQSEYVFSVDFSVEATLP